MRTDNRKVKNTVVSIYFVLIVFAILLATVFRSLELFVDSTFFLLLGVFIVMVVFHSIAGYFEYDSDGLKVTVTNKGLLLSEYLNYREHTIEFEKHRLSGFKINNYIIYKELVLFITSKGGHHAKKERFNITLVAKKKRKYMRQSLRKMVKQNRKEQS